MKIINFSSLPLMAALALVGASAASSGALAQAARPPVAPAPAPPPPPPDPNHWWTAPEVRPAEAVDPFGNRRWSKRDAQVRAGFTNGVDASLYRLWSLHPLQSIPMRRGETIYELWFRPTDSTRQAVIRVFLRADGETFVQARAGRGCCAPEITRRVEVNAPLTGEQRRALAALRDDPIWNQPRNVVVSEGDSVVTSVCVDGASYDLTLLTDRRAAHLRRSCDPAEIGSAVGIIRALVDAARGHDPRLDVVFAEQKLDRYALSYAQLQETGGRLKATSEDSGSAPPPPPAPPADEREEAEQAILAADRAFAARASQVSAAQAFREFMDAEEGLLFRPNGEPLQGAEAIFQHQGGNAPETGKLTWEPVEAWASESGDFGASWGRSKFTPLDPSRPAQAYRYMTVWRKDRDGRWKGLMDMGSPAADLLAVPAAPGGQPRPAVPQPQGVRPPSP